MASADLRDELTCPICTDIYTDPVTLTCGHNYCQDCITRTWDNQEEGDYSCPECRKKYRVRIPCTYCIASLCEEHLKIHSKSAEHVLTEPTTSPENRKCSVHKKVLEYYCCEDTACICVSCSLAGEHRGHQVETLNEASEKKKEKLRNIRQKLTSQREEAEKSIQNLEELRRQVQGKAAGVTERVTALIRDIRKQLEALEKQVLSEISRQEEQVSLRVEDLIRQLEIKKEELSRKMGDIEELCDMTDPVTVLQGRESDRDDYCDTEEDTERREIKVHDALDLDAGLISVTLHSGLRRPETPERFQYYDQVLSSRSFSSGRHYWKVEGSESGWWRVGMTYPSIKRGGKQSGIGNNNKSWSLQKSYNKLYYMLHDSNKIQFPHFFSCCRLGIFLDYEAGRLSFYELCDPIRHLHTFTAAFTEPLHAGFWVYGDNCWVRI
uniref:Uncharacterized protein n=1 Tax=Leptobrachium leishanense TaxID=445787 RepID=A0A8C5MKA3_9ANUR